MQAKKKTRAGAPVHAEDTKPAPRPVGMQTMGTTIYEQIRRTLAELDVKLASDN